MDALRLRGIWQCAAFSRSTRQSETRICARTRAQELDMLTGFRQRMMRSPDFRCRRTVDASLTSCRSCAVVSLEMHARLFSRGADIKEQNSAPLDRSAAGVAMQGI